MNKQNLIYPNIPAKYLPYIEKIKNKILEYKSIILLCHSNPDGDALGSVFGLGHFLKSIFPQKKIMYDSIEKDKQRYLSFLERLPLATKEDYNWSLIIIIDTGNRERINSLYWKNGAYIIKIDHHTSHDDYGLINWVDENRIAAAELIALLVFSYQKLIPIKAGNALYTGLVTDSNRFLYLKTDTLSFDIARCLTATGIEITSIYRKIYTQRIANFRLKAKIMSRMKISAKGVGKIVITKEKLARMRNDYNLIKSFVNLFNYIQGLEIWLIAIWNPRDKNVKVSIRSQFYNIEKIAIKYGGGGHKLAAGCKIDNFNKLPHVIKDLESLVINNDHEFKN